MPDSTVSTYRVELRNPRYEGELVLDLIATNQDRAVSRARLSAVHTLRDISWMDAGTTTRHLHAGTCSEQGHDREDCTPEVGA